MVPAFLVSLLSRQLALLGEHEFLRQHAHAWLVWEPGAWDPPGSPDESDLGATQQPRVAEHPTAGDALCFELVARSSHATLQVGRAPHCSIVLNDMTVSREHCQLVFDDDEWQLREADPAAAAAVLHEGAAVRAGGVTLTFHSAEGLVARLADGAHWQR